MKTNSVACSNCLYFLVILNRPFKKNLFETLNVNLPKTACFTAYIQDPDFEPRFCEFWTKKCEQSNETKMQDVLILSVEFLAEEFPPTN